MPTVRSMIRAGLSLPLGLALLACSRDVEMRRVSAAPECAAVPVGGPVRVRSPQKPEVELVVEGQVVAEVPARCVAPQLPEGAPAFAAIDGVEVRVAPDSAATVVEQLRRGTEVRALDSIEVGSGNEPGCDPAGRRTRFTLVARAGETRGFVDDELLSAQTPDAATTINAAEKLCHRASQCTEAQAVQKTELWRRAVVAVTGLSAAERSDPHLLPILWPARAYLPEADLLAALAGVDATMARAWLDAENEGPEYSARVPGLARAFGADTVLGLVLADNESRDHDWRRRLALLVGQVPVAELVSALDRARSARKALRGLARLQHWQRLFEALGAATIEQRSRPEWAAFLGEVASQPEAAALLESLTPEGKAIAEKARASFSPFPDNPCLPRLPGAYDGSWRELSNPDRPRASDGSTALCRYGGAPWRIDLQGEGRRDRGSMVFDDDARLRLADDNVEEPTPCCPTRVYDEHGLLLRQGTYRLPTYVGDYDMAPRLTGDVTFFHPNGARRCQGPDGGQATCWTETGAKEAEGVLDGGERTGAWTHFGESGALRARGEYRHDLRDGAWEEWDEKGRATIVHYCNGVHALEGTLSVTGRVGQRGRDLLARLPERWQRVFPNAAPDPDGLNRGTFCESDEYGTLEIKGGNRIDVRNVQDGWRYDIAAVHAAEARWTLFVSRPPSGGCFIATLEYPTEIRSADGHAAALLRPALDGAEAAQPTSHAYFLPAGQLDASRRCVVR